MIWWTSESPFRLAAVLGPPTATERIYSVEEPLKAELERVRFTFRSSLESPCSRHCGECRVALIAGDLSQHFAKIGRPFSGRSDP